MPSFTELEHLSKMNGLSMDTLLVLLDYVFISFLGTAVFAVLGAKALQKQSDRIDKEGARVVSVEWTIVLLATFTSLLPYGFAQDSLALVIQFLLRAPFYGKILWQLHRYHDGFSISQSGLALLMLLVTTMSFVWSAPISTGLLWTSMVFAAHQPYKIWHAESTEGVEIDVLERYLQSALFWTAYGFTTDNGHVISWAIGYSVVYAAGIATFLIYRKPPKR